MTRRGELRVDYPPAGVELRLIQQLTSLRGKSILEIGCGDGRLTTQSARLASRVVAIDPDPAMIRTARRAAAETDIGKISYRVGGAEGVRFIGAFDVALFSHSL